MSQEQLHAILIGAGGLGAHALEALVACPLLELVGVADRDAAAAAEAAAHGQCPAYDDNRRALVEPRPDIAFLAVPPAAAAEAVGLAAERELHIWTQAPLARNLPEAVEMCRLTRAADVKFAVGTQRRFARSYQRARQLARRLGEIYLLNAQYLFNWAGPLGWRGSAAAGGGAMLQLGYHMIDLIAAVVGLPETVYCITGTNQRAGGGDDQAVYDTDDTATAICRCRGETTATVTVSRRFSPVTEQLSIYGDGGSILATPSRCVLRDRDGAVVESFESGEPPAAVFARQVEAFARAVSEWTSRYECSGWENLRAAAVVEAAYLSARTGQPESPGALLAGYDVAAADCMAFAPAREPDDET